MALLLAVSLAVLLPVRGESEPAPAANDPAVLERYLIRQIQQDTVVSKTNQEIGKPFAGWSSEDYATFLAGLDLRREADLGVWSQVTGISLVAVQKGYDFFRVNAHLLADRAAADRMSAEELAGLHSEYDRLANELAVRDATGASLPLRSIASDSVRVLAWTAQILHNANFAGDQTSFRALGPYLTRIEELPYFDEVQEAIQSLPLSVVQTLRGKALYLSTVGGAGEVAIWHDVSSNRSPDHVGLQPGVFLEWKTDGSNVNELLRGIARIIRETVLEGRFFGIYAHPLQFPEFQKLNAERQRLFGMRRDEVPQTDHGYINDMARIDPTIDFVEHFVAYLTEPESFRESASTEQEQGYPKLMQKYLFMDRLVNETPTTIEPLAPKHIAYFDSALQREILQEYQVWQAKKDGIVAAVASEFGKPFRDFTRADYARFMAGLDLHRDADLWTWSHATGIPVVAVSQRSNVFHMNAHLLADVSAVNLMPWSELTKMRSSYDAAADRLTVSNGSGQPLRIRDLPDGIIQRTEYTDGLLHNQGFTEDRIVYEALEPFLVRFADLENREELIAGIRLLPLSIIKTLRGKAIYPTTRSRTGWTVTWRVGTDTDTSFVGMQPGSFVEPRRDQVRAPLSKDSLVERGLGSRRGSSADGLVHELGHIIDSAVIGRANEGQFPYQFPDFQSMRSERDRVFGETKQGAAPVEYGYISRYSAANAYENFAEHFWAYVRDRKGFLSRARKEQSEGHPELMEKFRFMEELVEDTPALEVRLSPKALEDNSLREEGEREKRAVEALAEYRFRLEQKESVVAAVERRLGKNFSELTRDEYARFIDGLDLSTDDDLWKWSHVAGIPIVGLTRKSNFFYANAHLMEDTQAAVRMSGAEVIGLRTDYDEVEEKLTLTTSDGHPLRLREIPAGTIRQSVRTGRFSHDEEFAEPRTVLETLAPYLVTLDSIPNRQAIAKALEALPLDVVKAYRGKAIYFTTLRGRSYTVGMPVSNSTYEGFAGMQAGVFLDQNRDTLTTHNLVHEIGHVIDYTVIQGQYGNYLHPYQFPEFRRLRSEKEIVFGPGDDPVPQTDHGYVSRYARSNAQESFAEHFTYFILQRDKFLAMAEAERAAGQAGLMEKYRFIETLLERTPATSVRLSHSFIETLGETGSVSQLTSSPLHAPPEPWRSVHDALSEDRDRMAADLERARVQLMTRAVSQGDRELIERLSLDPLSPRPSGYQILPEVIEDDPPSAVQLSERTYSLELLSEGFLVEFRDAANLADRASSKEDLPLDGAVAEFERLRERLDDLEDHLAYHAEWQPAVIEYAEFFAVRNRLVAEVRRMKHLQASGESDEAARIGHVVAEELAPFQPTPDLALVREAGQIKLPVKIYTDITDEGFLDVLREAIRSAFCDSEAARSSGFELDLVLHRISSNDLYEEGAPDPGSAIDVDAHLQRFPSGALVITTGAASTHGFKGRAVALGSSPVTRRTLAHEFAHLLGFDDAYLRGYDGDPHGPFGVVVVEWTGFTDDLMANPRGGEVTGDMIETLIKAYDSHDGLSE